MYQKILLVVSSQVARFRFPDFEGDKSLGVILRGYFLAKVLQALDTFDVNNLRGEVNLADVAPVLSELDCRIQFHNNLNNCLLHLINI